MKQLLTIGVTLLSLSGQAQLVIQNGATFFIDAGATVTVQGDVVASTNISGTGKLLMKGASLQNLNLNGFSVPNLEIDNAAHVALGGAARVEGVLSFTNGKLQLGNYNLTVANAGSFSGAGVGKFVETNGTGELRKELAAAGTITLPLGTGSDYTPLQYQLTGGTYSSAFVGGRAVSGGHPAKHPRSTDYLNTYWALNRSGITGATVTAVGTYADPSDVTGVEADMRAMTYNGSTWSLGTAQDNAANSVSATMPTNTLDLYAMNRFLLVTPKVFLQGAFDAATGLMRDRLRNSTGTYNPGTLPASNLLPTTDPYRTAPYSSFFNHTNNTIAENISSSVLNDMANPDQNIVDWVFVELRNATGPTTAPILQTRSALLRRNGTIVDVDGVSPVYFKNLDPGSNYVVTVKHRNHLGISSTPVSPISLGLSNTEFDFTNAANTAAIYGVANTNYTQINSKNVMWAGNARNNNSSSWAGLNNDKDYLYINVLSSNSGAPITGYSIGDLNMNRTASWSGLNNDKDFLYISVLGSNSGSGGTKSQAIPN